MPQKPLPRSLLTNFPHRTTSIFLVILILVGLSQVVPLRTIDTAYAAALNVTITSVNSDTFGFVTDSNQPDSSGPGAAYTGFTITNTGSTTLTNLSATLSGLSNFTFGGGQPSTIFIGTLTPGASYTVYYYLDYPRSKTSYTDNLTLTVSDGLGNTATHAESITTNGAISAQAGGQVNSYVLGPGAVVGQIITYDVTYAYGNNGNGNVAFQPSGMESFKAGCFQLVSDSIISETGIPGIITGTTNTLYVQNVSPSGSSNGNIVSVEYDFLIKCAGVTTTASPYSDFLSGNQYKYTQNFNLAGATITVPTTTLSLGISKSVTPTAVLNGGTVTYTVSVSNSFTQAATMFDYITDTLPSGVTFGGLVSSSFVSSSNSIAMPSTGATGNLVFQGNPLVSYKVPAGSAVNLVFTATVPNGDAVYTNTVTGSTGQANLGTAQAAVYSGPNAVTGLTVSNDNLNFMAPSGATTGSSQSIYLHETDPANWTSKINYTSGQGGWLSLSQSSGSLFGNGQTKLTLTTNPAGLADGKYTANVVISDGSSSKMVTVNLIVGKTYTYYVPFVGNNANGYSSFVSLHNIGGSSANPTMQFFDKSGNALTTTAANVCSDINANAVCSPSNPFNAGSGTAVIYSNQPLSVLVAESTPFGGSAYTVPAGASAQLVAPLAINNSMGFNTQLTVLNGGNLASQVTATFYDQQGNIVLAASKTLALPAHSSQTLDQSATDSNLPQGFYGWVQLSGTAGSQLTAQVLEENASAKFVALLNAEANAQSKLYAPAIFKNAFGSFVTGANIVNPNNKPEQVNVSYYDQNGKVYPAATFTLAANGVQPVYQGSSNAIGLPEGGLPDNFIGSALVSTASGDGLVVMVNQAGGLTAGGTARSGTYLAAGAGSDTIGLPAIANGSNGFTSGVTVLNSSDGSVSGYIQYYDNGGNAVGSQHSFTIAPHASALAYQGADNLPTGFSGEAVVVQTSGSAGSLLATTNVQSSNVFYSYVEPVQ